MSNRPTQHLVFGVELPRAWERALYDSLDDDAWYTLTNDGIDGCALLSMGDAETAILYSTCIENQHIDPQDGNVTVRLFGAAESDGVGALALMASAGRHVVALAAARRDIAAFCAKSGATPSYEPCWLLRQVWW